MKKKLDLNALEIEFPVIAIKETKVLLGGSYGGDHPGPGNGHWIPIWNGDGPPVGWEFIPPEPEENWGDDDDYGDGDYNDGDYGDGNQGDPPTAFSGVDGYAEAFGLINPVEAWDSIMDKDGDGQSIWGDPNNSTDSGLWAMQGLLDNVEVFNQLSYILDNNETMQNQLLHFFEDGINNLGFDIVDFDNGDLARVNYDYSFDAATGTPNFDNLRVEINSDYLNAAGGVVFDEVDFAGIIAHELNHALHFEIIRQAFEVANNAFAGNGNQAETQNAAAQWLLNSQNYSQDFVDTWFELNSNTGLYELNVGVDALGDELFDRMHRLMGYYDLGIYIDAMREYAEDRGIDNGYSDADYLAMAWRPLTVGSDGSMHESWFDYINDPSGYMDQYYNGLNSFSQQELESIFDSLWDDINANQTNNSNGIQP